MVSSFISQVGCSTQSAPLIPSQHILSISDGSSQLPVHPPNAKGQGLYPVIYSPEPGWNQPRGHPFLSPAVYSLHAMPLPCWPAHSPLQGYIHTPTIQHAP